MYDLEVAGVHNFAVATSDSTGVIVHNSEYMHIDNSACNLASINLLKYLRDDDTFDAESFNATIDVVFTAQEILVGNADYPTEKIAENSRRYRELGLGYCNLGALLMAQGVPYDSDEGRAWAASITALMTGHAYAVSARTASRMGPFAGFHADREAMLNVLQMHRAEVAKIDEELVSMELLSAAQEAWDDAVELGEQFGVRNSQASVLAPTGTIALMLDCDTTGVEPDLGLVKTKKLVGGGTMSIVNQTVPRALARLGYMPEQVDDIISYIDEHKSIVGAPHLVADHMAVFACSMGDNTIHYTGHVRMMGAVQPFISGAISKCVVGETLLATADGLIRIGGLHDGESPDSFRDEILAVASIGGIHKTDAFYYGGTRPVRRVVLRSGHTVTGTPNHRVLTAGTSGLDWKRLDQIEPGDYVATKYGDELWSELPARFDDFTPTPAYGSQKMVRIPDEMTDSLAFFLGAYASEGHTSRSTWTVIITNSEDAVLEEVAEAARVCFDVDAKIRRPVGPLPERRAFLQDDRRVPRVPGVRRAGLDQADPRCRAPFPEGARDFVPPGPGARCVHPHHRRQPGQVGDLPRCARAPRRPAGRPDEPRCRARPDQQVQPDLRQELRRGVRRRGPRQEDGGAGAVHRDAQVGGGSPIGRRGHDDDPQHGRPRAGDHARRALCAGPLPAPQRLRGAAPHGVQLPGRSPDDST